MQPIAGAVERQNLFDNYRQITCSGDKKWDFMGTLSKIGIYAAAFFGILWAGLTLSTIPAILVGVVLGSAAIGLHMLFQCCVCPSGEFFRGSSYRYMPQQYVSQYPETFVRTILPRYIPPAVRIIPQPPATGQHAGVGTGQGRVASPVRQAPLFNQMIPNQPGRHVGVGNAQGRAVSPVRQAPPFNQSPPNQPGQHVGVGSAQNR